MLPPSSGSVSWQGTDLYALTDDERARIRREHFGVVLQDGGLLQGLTALENVLVPVLNRRATRADRQRARDALAMVGLSARADHSPQNLSGGEGQRVAVARALFSDPKLLFVDEPTASLDRRNADDIIGLLVEVARDGRGVLLASHDPAVIAVADRFHEIEVAIAQASPKSLAPR
jgi:putative ABC transport system ATP-binding protein